MIHPFNFSLKNYPFEMQRSFLMTTAIIKSVDPEKILPYFHAEGMEL